MGMYEDDTSERNELRMSEYPEPISYTEWETIYNHFERFAQHVDIDQAVDVYASLVPAKTLIFLVNEWNKYYDVPENRFDLSVLFKLPKDELKEETS